MQLCAILMTFHGNKHLAHDYKLQLLQGRALDYRASLVDTTAPGGNVGHSDLYGPDRGIVFGH